MGAIERAEPEPSNFLLGLVEEINRHFESAKEFVVKAYNQALSEGFTPIGAKKFLYENITIFSDRTIRKYLPAEAKDLSKVRSIDIANYNENDFAEALPQTALDKFHIVKEAATTNPEVYGYLWRRLNNINPYAMLVNRIYRKFIQTSTIEGAKKLALERIPPNKSKSEKFDVICKDFLKITCEDIPDNSIDAVFVDPPYAKEYRDFAKPLGELCYRAQRAGTSLFIVAPNSGESYEHYFDTIRECGFKWLHYIPIILDGDIDRLHDNRILVYQKPLLWFYKPGPEPDGKMTIYRDIQNIIYSEAPERSDKDAFEWLQSPKEVKHVLEAVTVPGMRVLDPMMGEGTTGIGALELGLYFTGIEIDKERSDKAYFKLSDTQARLSAIEASNANDNSDNIKC